VRQQIALLGTEPVKQVADHLNGLGGQRHDMRGKVLRPLSSLAHLPLMNGI
jgi:hypothetical protein